MISYESLDFLEDLEDKLNLTVDLDKFLTLNDTKSMRKQSFHSEIETEISDKEFNDFICGVPKKPSVAFSQSDVMFDDDTICFDRNCDPNNQNYLTDLRTKIINMIQKEKRMQEEIKKLLNNE